MAHIIDKTDFTAPDIIKILDKNSDGYFKRADRQYKSWFAEEGLIYPDDAPANDDISEIVREALVLFVSMWVCRDNMGYDYRQVADGVQEDPYAIKYKEYKKSYNAERLRVNIDILKKRAVTKGTASGQIFRG